MENILLTKSRLTEQELSEYWGIKRKTLQKWRSLSIGPTYIKIGARVIYPREAIISFERERLFRGSGTRIDPTEAMNKHLFEKYAKYFRNALVRANYQNLEKNIPYSMEYLNKFFGNLLLGEKNRLDDREMQIKGTGTKTTQKILNMLAKNPSATRAELAAATGLTVDGVKWNLNKLKESGKIRRVGPDRGGHWVILRG